MGDIKDRRPGGGGGQGQYALFHDNGDGTWDLSTAAHLRVWDATDGAWNKVVADHSTGGIKVYVAGQAGGGSAVSVSDGSDVAEGTTSDAAYTSGSVTVVSILKGIFGKFTDGTQRGSFKLLDTAGTNVGAIDSSGALASNLTKVGSTAVDTNSGNKSAGTQRVVIATDQPSLSNPIPVTESGTWNVGLSKTGTGYSGYFMDALSTTVQTVSASAGKFGGLIGVINVNSGPAYIQLFDTTGAVTLGTTAPTYVIGIPCNATAANGVAIVAALDVGINLANGLKIAATSAPKTNGALGTGLTGTLYYA